LTFRKPVRALIDKQNGVRQITKQQNVVMGYGVGLSSQVTPKRDPNKTTQKQHFDRDGLSHFVVFDF
jgi:hypothetical protein